MPSDEFFVGDFTEEWNLSEGGNEEGEQRRPSNPYDQLVWNPMQLLRLDENQGTFGYSDIRIRYSIIVSSSFNQFVEQSLGRVLL